MRANSIRRLLDAGEPTIGTHLFLDDPAVVETVGRVGTFDYVEFLAEYSPYSLRSLDDFCRATELHGLGSMIKVDFEGHTFIAQRSVGSGFESVLFADARSPEDVRSFVRSLKPDTPEHRGLFGVGARRHSMPAYGGTPPYVEALDQIVIAVMIEKAGAVEQLDEIVEIPGIDMVQWGPSDYSMSIGRPGDEKHASVIEAEKRVIARCHEAGIPCRAEIGTVEDAKYYMDLGVRHFSLGYDLFTLHDALKDGGERLRTAIADA